MSFPNRFPVVAVRETSLGNLPRQLLTFVTLPSSRPAQRSLSLPPDTGPGTHRRAERNSVAHGPKPIVFTGLQRGPVPHLFTHGATCAHGPGVSLRVVRTLISLLVSGLPPHLRGAIPTAVVISRRPPLRGS